MEEHGPGEEAEPQCLGSQQKPPFDLSASRESSDTSIKVHKDEHCARAEDVHMVFSLIPPLEETDRLLNIIQMIALTADSSSGLNQQFVGINDGGGRRLASAHAVHRLTSFVSRL